MQREILELLMAGRELCARELSEELKISRQYASSQLAKTARGYKFISWRMHKMSIGVVIYSVKYYYIKKKQS